MKTLGSFSAHVTRWLALALPIVLAACGGGSDAPAAQGMGTLRLALTDAPACGYAEVNVTVERIRVHQSGSAGDGDSGWSEIVPSPARQIDLLKLTNGALEELGQTALPAGKYTQMRLVLASNGGTRPLANSVKPTGGGETALTTPSGQQTGLKMNVNIDVEPNKMADFIIDFDACKSVVRRGNSGQYNLKPVLSVLPRLMDAGARVIGYLDPTTMAAASVSVQASGVPVRATAPDPTSGRFELYPVLPGSYDLVISGAGRVTGVMTGVPVTENTFTFVNASTQRIALGVGAAQDLSGQIAIASSITPTGVFASASQTLTGGTTVQVSAIPVDTSASSPYPYSMPLASNAPVVAPYSSAYQSNAIPVPFVADAASGVAGTYTVAATVTQEASAPLVRTTATPVSVPASGVNFSFP